MRPSARMAVGRQPATKSGETISDQIQCQVLDVWIPGYVLNGAHGLADAFCLVESVCNISPS